jgi:hypothetical protein
VRHFPTELPVVDVHLEQLDTVFELADGSLLHLAFQTVAALIGLGQRFLEQRDMAHIAGHHHARLWRSRL